METPKRKLKRHVTKLTEEDLKNIRKNLEMNEVALISSSITRDSLKRQIDANLPMIEAKMQFEQIDAEVKRVENNVKALRKQIRTGTIINLTPVV